MSHSRPAHSNAPSYKSASAEFQQRSLHPASWCSGPSSDHLPHIAEMIHLMELPSPDPTEGRPEHGGRDRHVCLGLEDIRPLEDRLRAADIKFTRSKSGRAA